MCEKCIKYIKDNPEEMFERYVDLVEYAEAAGRDITRLVNVIVSMSKAIGRFVVEQEQLDLLRREVEAKMPGATEKQVIESVISTHFGLEQVRESLSELLGEDFSDDFLGVKKTIIDRVSMN